MKRRIILAIVFLSSFLAATFVGAQDGQIRHERRPATPSTAVTPVNAPQPNYDFFSILDGQPRSLTIHHDTMTARVNRSTSMSSQLRCRS